MTLPNKSYVVPKKLHRRSVTTNKGNNKSKLSQSIISPISVRSLSTINDIYVDKDDTDIPSPAVLPKSELKDDGNDSDNDLKQQYPDRRIPLAELVIKKPNRERKSEQFSKVPKIRNVIPLPDGIFDDEKEGNMLGADFNEWVYINDDDDDETPKGMTYATVVRNGQLDA